MARRIIGLALIVAGGALLGVLFYPSFAHSLATAPLLTSSMPGALLLCMIALIFIAWGGVIASPERPLPRKSLPGPSLMQRPRRGARD